jgi:methylase of polypeptide subunit release factors
LLREGQKLPDELHVLDLCTGTGCIPLLFRYEFESVRADVNLHTVGVDIAERSMSLAYYNMNKLHKGRVGDKGSTKFIKADVLATSSMSDSGGSPALETALNRNQMPKYWDVLISNPPYISPSAYWKTTTRSVRGFEPKLALVPPSKAGLDDVQQGDMFYPRLLEIARDVKAKVVLLEVADLEQALRVARCARNLNVFDDIEVWRDSPDLPPAVPTTEHEHGFSILGQGNARSVVCWCGPGALWLGKA